MSDFTQEELDEIEMIIQNENTQRIIKALEKQHRNMNGEKKMREVLEQRMRMKR